LKGKEKGEREKIIRKELEIKRIKNTRHPHP